MNAMLVDETAHAHALYRSAQRLDTGADNSRDASAVTTNDATTATAALASQTAAVGGPSLEPTMSKPSQLFKSPPLICTEANSPTTTLGASTPTLEDATTSANAAAIAAACSSRNATSISPVLAERARIARVVDVNLCAVSPLEQPLEPTLASLQPPPPPLERRAANSPTTASDLAAKQQTTASPQLSPLPAADLRLVRTQPQPQPTAATRRSTAMLAGPLNSLTCGTSTCSQILCTPLRTIVSQNRRRFEHAGFNLDLTCAFACLHFDSLRSRSPRFQTLRTGEQTPAEGCARSTAACLAISRAASAR